MPVGYPRLLQEEGWSVMKHPDFPFSDVYPAGSADFDIFPGARDL